MSFNKIHFIGIGGIGVSAIARMMLLEGKEVSGSDVSESLITKQLSELGVKIFFNHKRENPGNSDLVIYSPAVAADNPEILEAEKRGVPIFSYPEMLGEISRDKFTIAVSGSHGKTTTTAMIGGLLKDAGLDPTIIVGSLLKDAGSNFVSGKSQYFVAEACEYKKSFLNLKPKIAVITNIDNDHLDYYKNMKNIQKAFREFADRLGEDGYLVCDAGNPRLKPLIENTKYKIIDYSKFPRTLKLKIPGNHNLNNAQAALAVAEILKIKKPVAKTSLENFSGTWRRFEYKGKTKSGALVYDDYAHHPTEIKATLAGAREMFQNKRIFCIFQPHLYSRTKLLMDDFSESFSDADVVMVADIYAAREADLGNISSSDLVKKIYRYHGNVVYARTFGEAADFALCHAEKGDVIFTMGAGDIYKVGELLLRYK